MKNTPEPRIALDRRHAWLSGRSEDRFARQFESIDELAVPIQQAFLERLQPGEMICQIIYAPFQGHLKHYRSRRHFLTFTLPWEFTPDYVLLLTDRRLFLARLPDPDTCKIEVIPLDALLYLRSGVVLLLSWLEFCWVREGVICREMIYFNTVCDRIFNTLAEIVRGYLVKDRSLWSVQAQEDGSNLSTLPYKFMIAIPNRLMLPREQVCRVLFRPAIYHTFLGWLHHVTAPRLALALTNCHLLLASENVSGSEGDYGLVSTFLPLSRIRGAEVFVSEDQSYLLVHLAYAGAYEDFSLPFPLELEFELRCFVDAVNSSL